MANWIDDYLDYTASQESPRTFHQWCGLAVIASVLDRKVWLDRRSPEGIVYFTSYPGQLSICLVAGAGRCKKSTAVTIAKQFMKEAGVALFDGKITPERLLNKLGNLPGKRPVLTIVASELSAFLGRQSYNDGMIDNLNKLLDCESSPYETQKLAPVVLTNPCLTMLMASTPSNLGKAIPPQAHDHGFLSRHIFVYSEQPGSAQPLAFNEDDVDPSLLLASRGKHTALVTRLRSFASLQGQFRWTTAGRAWYERYYNNYRNSAQSDNEGYPQRRPDHLTRVAMCLRVASGKSLFLDEEELALADQWLAAIEPSMPRAFAFIGQHANAEQQQRIVRIFKEAQSTAGGICYVNGEELYHKAIRYFASDFELQNQMRLLLEAGVIGTLGREPLPPQGNGKQRYVLLKEPY